RGRVDKSRAGKRVLSRPHAALAMAFQPSRPVPPPLPPALRPPPLPGASAAAVSRHTVPLLSPDELDRFKNLLLFAQATVDGFFAGRHRSPHPGSSAEFRDYKDYVAGDALDRIDWRAYGRTRRLFVRRYED